MQGRMLNNRDTPLVEAIRGGRAHVVASFIANGVADVNQMTCGGDTLLYVASQAGHIDIVFMLLAMGVAVNQPSCDGETPLIVACFMGHADIVSLLIAAGAAVEYANQAGATPLNIASQQGDAAIVSTLIGAAASVNHVCHDPGCWEGRTILLSQVSRPRIPYY